MGHLRLLQRQAAEVHAGELPRGSPGGDHVGAPWVAPVGSAGDWWEERRHPPPPEIHSTDQLLGSPGRTTRKRLLGPYSASGEFRLHAVWQGGRGHNMS